MSLKIHQQISTFISFIEDNKNGIDPFTLQFSESMTAKKMSLGSLAEGNEVIAKREMKRVDDKLRTLDTDYGELLSKVNNRKRKYNEIEDMSCK